MKLKQLRDNKLLLQEDFQPMMYGFKTAPELTSTRVCGMMKEVEDELNRVIKVGHSAVLSNIVYCVTNSKALCHPSSLREIYLN